MTKMRKFMVISSYAPPAVSGAPLMMYNLLHHFPPRSFSILTSHAGIDDRASATEKRLAANYHYFDTPSTTFTDDREQSFSQKLKSTAKRIPIVRSIGEFILLITLISRIVKKGSQIAREENIELLLGYSDYGAALTGTYILHKRTGLPYFLYFYDLYAGTKLPFFSKILARIMEPCLFRSAEHIFVMSGKLADHYRTKYGRESTIIYNSPPIPQNKPSLPAPQKPYKIVYTGTIYWAQADAVRDLIAAVEGGEEGVELWLYTPHDPVYLARFGIRASKRVKFAVGNPEEMPRIQAGAAILAVLLGFKTGYPLLISTSSPGKTYEYMLSGRPILVHAPKDSFIAEYVMKYKCGYVVGEPDIDELREGISKLLHDRTLVTELVRNAWATAVQNHDASKNAAKLEQFFVKQ
jgi:glycosyltransferase involved in cell wall biosynthesis